MIMHVQTRSSVWKIPANITHYNVQIEYGGEFLIFPHDVLLQLAKQNQPLKMDYCVQRDNLKPVFIPAGCIQQIAENILTLQNNMI